VGFSTCAPWVAAKSDPDSPKEATTFAARWDAISRALNFWAKCVIV